MMNLYQGTGKVLAIKNATTYSINIKYVKLTELPDCVKPQQVETTLVTDDAVTVNWIAGLEEAWEIKVNDSIIENVTTQPYRVTGLEQGTVYTVAVRALCDAEHTSEWSIPVKFQTECGVNPLPMNEDFSALPNPLGSNNLARATLTCWDNLVSTNKIEEVFKGTEKPFPAPGNIYAGQTWVQNWLSALGDYAQLHSYHGVYNPTYRYKWFISPQYAIEGNATLSFDVRRCGNKGQKVEFDAGRFFVAISTDNGATWKKEDATQITEIDTVYSTKSISLDQYAGKAIRVAFYDENNVGSYDPANFLLIDNVRMNCTEEYPVADNACQGYDYEGYGFSIKAEELPVAGQDSTYYRFAASELGGCDSTIALTITTRVAAEPTTLYETICEGDYYEFGGQKLTKPNPEGIPYQLLGETVYGCDSLVYLYLSVQQNDTATFNVTAENSELPKEVDAFYTIPADAPIGLPFDTLIKLDGCAYNRYFVTVNRCTDSVGYADQVCAGARYEGYGFVIEVAEQPAAGESKLFSHIDRTALGCDSMTTLTLTVMSVKQTILTDNICESETTYEGYNFVIDKAEWPAAGESKDFFDYRTSVEGCDSIVKLTLAVTKADTTTIPVVINADKLPYIVDAIYTVPAESQVGSFVEILPNGEDCGYNRYEVTINDVGTGLINLSDEVDHIEVFDALGRRVRTLRQGDEQYNLPAGVYMLHTVMKSGKAENRKVTLK
jgi:hypothetical protein